MTEDKDLMSSVVLDRLTEIKEQERTRQRKYQSLAKSQGRVRVNTYLTAEASEVLRIERQKGRSVTDILSEALLLFYQSGA